MSREKEQKVYESDVSPSQVFEARIRIHTECKERVNEDEVKKWVEDQFEGCDLGNVVVERVDEHSVDLCKSV